MTNELVPLTKISSMMHDGSEIYGIENISDSLVEVEYLMNYHGHQTKGKNIIHPRKTMWFAHDASIEILSEKIIDVSAASQ